MKKKKTKIKYSRIIKWIIILLVIGYALTGYARGINLGYDIRRSTMPEIMVENEIDTMSPIELVDYVTGQYNAPQELIEKITMCESSHNFNAVHDSGKGVGITGFQRQTFEDWKVTFNRPDLVYESNFDQLVLMSLAFNAGEKYRDAWTTYVAYQNGGEYRFTDRKGVKHIARCK
tara:strand:+ start:291 stop:815 length:525 start_codon:yes stop_codon:yes gene_type:complete